jgi:hypothetical protein
VFEQVRCDPFCIDHGFRGRDIEVQVQLVNPTEGTRRGAERRACPFTGEAVDLASAVPVVISGSCVDAVANRGLGGVTPAVALPCISIQLCAAGREVVHNALIACPSVGVVAHPKPLFARRTRDDPDDGGPIMGIGVVPLALIRAPAWQIRRIAMGGCFSLAC